MDSRKLAIFNKGIFERESNSENPHDDPIKSSSFKREDLEVILDAHRKSQEQHLNKLLQKARIMGASPEERAFLYELLKSILAL